MTHAIIRGKNGRRHEVDFGESLGLRFTRATRPVEADTETMPDERRRFGNVD